MQDGKQDGVVVESCFANFSLKRAVEVFGKAVFGKAFLDSGRIFNRIRNILCVTSIVHPSLLTHLNFYERHTVSHGQSNDFYKTKKDDGKVPLACL